MDADRIVGGVGKAVQAGVVHGGIHIHGESAGSGLPCRFGQVPLRAEAYQERALSGLDAGCVVLVGMGGAGKTQVAAGVAQGAREAGVGVLAWVNAGSREQVVSAYMALAARIGGVEREPEEAVDWVLGWLDSTSESWLVVLDDVGSPADVRGLVPAGTATGRVVVTTRERSSVWRGQGRSVVQVGLFTEEQARECLGRWLVDQPRLLDGVDELIGELERLPLAVGQAGAYLSEQEMSCSEYLERFRERDGRLSELFPDGERLPVGLDRVVAVTWSMSVGRADEQEPAGLAGPLMHVLSVLDSHGIPMRLLGAWPLVQYLSTGRDALVGERDVLDAARCLARMNLIGLDGRPGFEATGIRVHALVQRATRELVSVDRLAVQVRVAADALSAVWPRVESTSVFTEVLRANAMAVIGVAEGLAPDPLWGADGHAMLFTVGHSWGSVGQVGVARDYLARLSERSVRILGVDHPDTLAIRHNAAHWRGRAGDFAGALDEAQSVLVDRSRVLGADHPDTLITRNSIVRWRRLLGDIGGGLAELQRILADRERVLGPDHPDTLVSRNNIASWRGRSGDVMGALADFRALLADRERVLGPDHPGTLTARSNVASWRGRSGDVAGAVADLSVLLVDRSRVLGVDHPSTLVTRSNLAHWLGEGGDAVGALAGFRAVLADRERVLGVDHPDTVRSRRSVVYWEVMVEEGE
ncbi:tetratricopeptide repeat protein [Actinokineospora enzanensis]|uniref:tetratricopeptide repeat protein n=1 Tax=Actinokineospora enzanensis TaxID=155975 RepID=UPI00039EB07E|nr:tetratricopeptide repeat protein [Actinokineospora enzanensis]